MTGARRRVTAAVAVALLAGALTTWATRPAAEDDPADLRSAAAGAIAAIGTPTPAEATTAPTTTPAPTTRTTPRMLPAAPTELIVPRLGARMQVEPVGVDRRGDMNVPADPRVAGWYRFGSRPGSADGATVLAAHVDDSEHGTGPLAGLGSLRRGDPVTVAAGRVTRRYTVSTVLRLDKDELDTDALFDRAGEPRLHLVTCGGAFDRATGHYEDNIVVIATPVG